MYFIEGRFWSKVAVNFVSVLLAYNAPSICPSRFRWSWDTAAAVVLLLLFRVHIPSVDTYCVLGLNKAYYWLPTAYEYSSSDFTSRFDILPCVQDVYYWCVVIHPSVNRSTIFFCKIENFLNLSFNRSIGRTRKHVSWEFDREWLMLSRGAVDRG